MTKGGEIVKLTREKTIEKDFLYFLQNASIVSINVTSAFGIQIIFEFNEQDDLDEYNQHSPYLQINGETIYNEGKRMVEVNRIFVKLVLVKNTAVADFRKSIYLSDRVNLWYTSYNDFMGEIISQIDVTNKTNDFLASVSPQILYYKLVNPLEKNDSQLTTLFVDAINDYQKNYGYGNIQNNPRFNIIPGLLKLFKTDNTFIGVIAMEMLPGNFDDLNLKNDFQVASGIYELIRAGTAGYIHMDAHVGNIKWLPNYHHYYKSDNPSEDIKGRAILIDWGMVAKMNLTKNTEFLLELFNKEINEQNVLECVNFYKRLYVQYVFTILHAKSPLLDINLAINPALLQELVRVFKLRKNEEQTLLNKENELNNIYEWWNREKSSLITISNTELDFDLVEWPAIIEFGQNESGKSHFSFVSSSSSSSSSLSSSSSSDKSADASSSPYYDASSSPYYDASSSPYYVKVPKSTGGKTVKNKKRKLHKSRKTRKNKKH